MSMTKGPAPVRLPRAWYAASFADFLGETTATVLGQLTGNSNVPVEPDQRDAWIAQVELLKKWLRARPGFLLLEFNIPRMGLRADAILLIGGCVVVVEFKVGEKQSGQGALDQVWEYALDTKNFHEPSHELPIIPILVPTEFRSVEIPSRTFASDGVSKPIVASPDVFGRLLDGIQAENRATIDPVAWMRGRYKPTPTIIEAARHLYANHSVAEIVRTEADEKGLSDTARCVESVIERAQQRAEKTICFVTGVPGAGKTLVGLNIATLHRNSSETHAVFLSGNDPLVMVLREALTRDDVARRKQRGISVTKAQASKPIKAFIQNVHHFRDEGLRDRERPPVDRIVIFDEAQRAWNREKTSHFMQRRKGISGFNSSEPEFLLDYMNRHDGWAVVICLVGGGQEIHTGEAGIGAWIDACVDRFPNWNLRISKNLLDEEYGAGKPIHKAEKHLTTQILDDLHLTTSFRSFRAEGVSRFVKALLDCEVDVAGRLLDDFQSRYPVAITRNLDAAKHWVRSKSRGAERIGMLTSSKAMRLKPHAIDVRVAADPIHYFLNGADDVRSSFYLEDCATEFQVQGLELDWTVVAWDADLRRQQNLWSYHDFRGSKWQNIHSIENQRNLKNAYRVLLTRARQGMVIFVPPGNRDDPTRSPDMYDATFSYLSGLGLEQVRA